MCEWLCARDVDSTLVLLLENDVGRLFVYPNAESFQFCFDDPFVCEGLIDIQYNENQIALFGDGNNLTTTTLSVLCSFDDTGKIQHLDLGAIVKNTTGNSRKLHPC